MAPIKIASIRINDLHKDHFRGEIIRAFKTAFPAGVFKFPQDMLDLPKSIRPHINSILSYYNLDCTNLHFNNCNFDGCNFSNISFSGSKFHRASLQNCIFSSTSFYHSDLSYSILHGSDLSNAVLRLCNLEGIQAEKVTITWTDFRNF